MQRKTEVVRICLDFGGALHPADSGMYVLGHQCRLSANSLQRNRPFPYRSPLHIAAQLSHLPTVQLLVQRGAAVNGRDEAGCTPLHLASSIDVGVCDDGELIDTAISD